MRTPPTIYLTTPPLPNSGSIDRTIAVRVDMIIFLQRVSVSITEAKQKGEYETNISYHPRAGAREATMVQLVNGGQFLVEEAVKEVVKKIEKKTHFWI